jgi:hypothetical protein
MRISTARFQSFFVAANLLLSTTLTFSPVPAHAATDFAATTGFGTYYKPFAPDSPWNKRPINPVLRAGEIKKPLYNPTWIPVVGDGALSLQVFMAKAGDPGVTIHGKPGTSGVGDPDTGFYRTITLPRWPANVVPASGADGHADVVDTVTGIVHSFYQLKYANGKWTAGMYSWSRLDGRGFGEGGHWSQGARASGVPNMGGLIRIHEIDDGEPYYRHALAMTLPRHTLSGGASVASYIRPATSTDSNAAQNSGSVPMGALIMLPSGFDTNKLSSPKLRKIAATLKLWGAYVVDSNYDTAYGIHVENGANFNLMPSGVWDTKVVADLELIRAALRQVAGAQSWIDGNGVTRTKEAPMGLLSMRGTWLIHQTSTKGPGGFDTWSQALVFPYMASKVTLINYNNEVSKVDWAKPVPGGRMRFESRSTGGATIRLQVNVAGKVVFDSGFLGNGAAATFNWPGAASGPVTVTLLAECGVNQVSSARGILNNVF